MRLKTFANGLLYGVAGIAVLYAGATLAARFRLTTTTAIVVRHAEKALDGGADPSLSAEGRLRAAALAHAVEDTNVAAAYCCTTCARTFQTVEPLGVPVTRIGDGDSDGLAADVFSNHAGKTVVIAGHSNTVPEIVAALGSRAAVAVADGEYDKLFVVIVHEVKPLLLPGLRRRHVDTLKLKYGARS